MRVFSRIHLYVKGKMGAKAMQTFKIPRAYSNGFSKALKEAIGQHVERIKTEPAPESKEGHKSKYMLLTITAYVHRIELLRETARKIFTELEQAEKERKAEEERKRVEAIAKRTQRKKKAKKKSGRSGNHSIGTHVKTVRLKR